MLIQKTNHHSYILGMALLWFWVDARMTIRWYTRKCHYIKNVLVRCVYFLLRNCYLLGDNILNYFIYEMFYTHRREYNRSLCAYNLDFLKIAVFKTNNFITLFIIKYMEIIYIKPTPPIPHFFFPFLKKPLYLVWYISFICTFYILCNITMYRMVF